MSLISIQLDRLPFKIVQTTSGLRFQKMKTCKDGCKCRKIVPKKPKKKKSTKEHFKLANALTNGSKNETYQNC